MQKIKDFIELKKNIYYAKFDLQKPYKFVIVLQQFPSPYGKKNLKGCIKVGEGIFKQKNGMLAVDIVAACGVMTVQQMAGLADLGKKTNVFRFKMTTRQTVVAVLGEENAEDFKNSLAPLGLMVSPYGNVVRAVKACAGNNALCPRAIVDALDLGIELQEKYIGRVMPKDFKIAVAGCVRGCTDPHCADFGVIGAGKDVFNVAIGGFGGSLYPLHGQIIAEKISKEDVFKTIDFILDKYTSLGEPSEKLGRTIKRVGLKEFALPDNFLIPTASPEADEFAQFLES